MSKKKQAIDMLYIASKDAQQELKEKGDLIDVYFYIERLQRFAFCAAKGAKEYPKEWAQAYRTFNSVSRQLEYLTH